jgi:hypothetical protein
MNSLATEERTKPSWLSLVQSQVQSLHFGTVQIVVHDSRVVQIERSEKLRFDRVEPAPPFVSGAVVAGESSHRSVNQPTEARQ